MNLGKSKFLLRVTLILFYSPEETLTYDVTVKTAKGMFAGTDNDVLINIIGSKGQSQFRKLDGKGNDFESGKTDKFEIRAFDLGLLLAPVATIINVIFRTDRGRQIAKGWQR